MCTGKRELTKLGAAECERIYEEHRRAMVEAEAAARWPLTGRYSYGLYSYGLHVHRLYSYGLHVHRLYSYGRGRGRCQVAISC